MTAISPQGASGPGDTPRDKAIMDEYTASLAAAERQRVEASHRAWQAYYAVMDPARQRYDEQVTDAWVRYKQAVDAFFGIGTGRFRCCDRALIPWPAPGADVRCPACGTVWEHDDVMPGGGARVKSRSAAAASAETHGTALPAGS